jgi:hypothetical protein
MSMPAENVHQIEGPVSRVPVVQTEASAVLGMIERVARDPSVNMDKMVQLMEWRKEMVADERRAAFDEAMASAKAEIPVISKNRQVDFTSQKGRTHYKYEDLAEIARVVSPILAKCGLSYRYRVTSNVNEPVTVTCIVSHRAGHFEEVTLVGGRDESGNKNSIQAVASTLTYLQRMTLKAALGLAASEDDDGRSSIANSEAEYTPPPGAIDEEQVASIHAALAEKGASEKAFLQWAKVKRIEDIHADLYDSCLDGIASFRKVRK